MTMSQTNSNFHHQVGVYILWIEIWLTFYGIDFLRISLKGFPIRNYRLRTCIFVRSLSPEI